MSRKIIGVTVGTQLPKPNFNQTDPTKGDYIKNKPDFDGLKAEVSNLAADVKIIDDALVEKIGYNEQTLTPEQQEQVRKNIGVVQPDYAQNDPAAPDYIKNRLAYTETKALTYDGNHDNRIPLRDGVYAAYVSDELIDLNDITKIVLTPENGNPITFEATSENVWVGTIDNFPCLYGYFADVSAPVIVQVPSDVDFGDFGYLYAGTYLCGYENEIMVGYISYVEYGDEIVHKLDPKYLPTNGFGYTEQTDNVIFESTLEFISESEGNPGTASSEYIDLKAGEKYIVIFDGVEYECEGFVLAQPGTNLVCVGNAGLAFGYPELVTDEPFIIAAVSSAEYAGCEFMLIDPSTFEPIIGEHTFKIIHKANVVHKIDPMFCDQLGWKEEKYVPVFNAPVEFYDGQLSQGFGAPLLEEGETYRVTYCGHTYEMKAEKVTYMGMPVIGIGDIGLVNDPPTPTVYPFVIGQYDTGSEYEVLVIALDPDAFPDEFIPMEGLQKVEVAHKKKIIQKIDPDLYERLAWEDTIVKEIIPETVIPGVYEQEVPFGITANTEYVVMFDGTEYRLTGRLLDASMDGADIHIEFIGNPALFALGDDNDLPFLIMDASAYGVTMAGISCLDDTVDHTISVTGTVVDVHKIDEKFLPEFPLSKTINTVNIHECLSNIDSDNKVVTFDGTITNESVVHVVIDGVLYNLPVIGFAAWSTDSVVYFAGNKEAVKPLVEDSLHSSTDGWPTVNVPYAFFQFYRSNGRSGEISDANLLSISGETINIDSVDFLTVDVIHYMPLDVGYLAPMNISWDFATEKPATWMDDICNIQRYVNSGLVSKGILNGDPVEIVSIDVSTARCYINVRNNNGVYYEVDIAPSGTIVRQISQSGSGDFTLPSTVPNITSATENQMVVVEAVDESGKPTSWKAVDVPEPIEYDVVQADYEQNDPSAPDYIKNRPVYTGTVIKCISWDGDLTGKYYDYDEVHISNTIMEEHPKIHRIVLTNGQEEKIAKITSYGVGTGYWCINVEIDTNDGVEKIYGCVSCEYAYEYVGDGTITPIRPLGIFFLRQNDNCSWWVSKFEYLEEGVQKLDEKYLPDCVASTAYVNEKIATIPTPDVSGQIDAHNVSTEAHNDIRILIDGLTTRLNTLADSDDITLDQMSEIIAYIKSNKSLIEGVTTNKVNVDDIVNNLTTSVSNKPLSAAQGVVLKSLIDAIVVPTKISELTNDKGYLTSAPVTSVNGKSGAVNLTALDVSALPDTTDIPSKLSDLTSDTTHRTVTDEEKTAWNAKAETSSIPTKVSQLTNDAGFITSYVETDPTVPAWAKASAKPTYTANEVGALPNTAVIPATSDMTEKVGINAEGQLVTKQIGGGIVDHILMRDAENGFTYIIEMRGGNLVSSAMCTGIRITKAPDKVDYVDGDLIDVTGMVVEAIYEDGTSNAVGDYTYSEFATADGVVSVSLAFMGINFTTSFNINVTSMDDYMADLLVDFKYTKFDYGGTYVVQDWKGTLNGEASTEIVIPNHNNITL